MISVCIATYNGERYIKKQILSIINQLSQNDEIIISDDHSTDNTLNEIKSILDGRIKIFINEPHKEMKRFNNYWEKLECVYLNFKNAFNHSIGDYIFLSDQDDLWYPNKVKTVFPILERQLLCVHNLSEIDASDYLLREVVLTGNLPRASVFHTILFNPYLGCCLAFHRRVGEVAFNSFRFNPIPHDTWIAIVATLIDKRKVVFINTPLLKYRIHSNNVSPADGKSRNGLCFRILYRINLIMKILFLKFFYYKKEKCF